MNDATHLDNNAFISNWRSLLIFTAVCH